MAGWPHRVRNSPELARRFVARNSFACPACGSALLQRLVDSIALERAFERLVEHGLVLELEVVEQHTAARTCPNCSALLRVTVPDANVQAALDAASGELVTAETMEEFLRRYPYVNVGDDCSLGDYAPKDEVSDVD